MTSEALDSTTSPFIECGTDRQVAFLFGIKLPRDIFVLWLEKAAINKCKEEFLFFWTLSIVRCLKEHDVSGTGSVSVLR
jgi:hypothetical protein